MVDVSAKPQSLRVAIATGKIKIKRATANAISRNRIGKGNVFATAQIAGIQAAKRTAELIPLCHPLPLSNVEIDFQMKGGAVNATCSARTTAQTGVEMEALVGVAVKAAAENHGWDVLAEAIVPDDKKRIQETIRSFSAQGCGLILTTGGTGVAERDVTPEAIREIMRVEIPGFGEVMRAQSMKITPNAILSRSLAAIVDSSLVIALPGKPSGAVECL